jgi:FkbM family methyltransferase
MNFEDPVTAFIDSHFANRKKVNFIQVGCNDGMNSDFMRPRVKSFGWSGILIEPHPKYIALAREAYGDCQTVAWENVAISDESVPLDLFFVADVPPDRYFMIGIASFDRAHLTRHGVLEENISSVKVPCVSLDSIIKKYAFFNTDLLVIDVEGHELNVFRSIDFTYFRPKLIVVEINHLAMGMLESLLSLLPESYRFVKFPGAMDAVIYDTTPSD